MQRHVRVDGKVRTDATYPAGFMDVVDIPKTDEHFRLVYDTKGRFVAHRITKARRPRAARGGRQVIAGAGAGRDALAAVPRAPECCREARRAACARRRAPPASARGVRGGACHCVRMAPVQLSPARYPPARAAAVTGARGAARRRRPATSCSR